MDFSGWSVVTSRRRSGPPSPKSTRVALTLYKDAAAKAGTPADAAGAATAKLLFERIPAGQYFKSADGRWLKK